MEALSQTGQAAESVYSFDESKIWYKGWVECATQLGEWENLKEVATISGDYKLLMEASTALQKWDNMCNIQINHALFNYCGDDHGTDYAEIILNSIIQKFNRAVEHLSKLVQNQVEQNGSVECWNVGEAWQPWLFSHKTREVNNLLEVGSHIIFGLH